MCKYLVCLDPISLENFGNLFKMMNIRRFMGRPSVSGQLLVIVHSISRPTYVAGQRQTHAEVATSGPTAYGAKISGYGTNQFVAIYCHCHAVASVR